MKHLSKLLTLGLSINLSAFAMAESEAWDFMITHSGTEAECVSVASNVSQALRRLGKEVLQSECTMHDGTNGWIFAKYNSEYPIYTNTTHINPLEWNQESCIAAKTSQLEVFARTTGLNPLSYGCDKDGKASIFALGDTDFSARILYIQDWMAEDARQATVLLGGIPAFVGTKSVIYYSKAPLEISSAHFGYFQNANDCNSQINELRNMQMTMGDRIVNPRCIEVANPRGSYYKMETLRTGNEPFAYTTLRDMNFSSVDSCLRMLPKAKATYSRTERPVIGGLCIPDTVYPDQVHIDLFYRFW